MKVEKAYLYTTDLKADIEHYLKNEIRLNPSILSYMSEKEELKLILYADDCCVSNNIGSEAKNITLTNFSYRIFISQLASFSKLYYYRCVAVA
uniref:Reverse transcriptase domain-containing protein n=1 Tax=Strongyloides stercoralis TaxID=6248 RepID=A0A0K0E4Z2_STRER